MIPPIGVQPDKFWPDGWFDATGYGNYYTAGNAYHTGADLNCNTPVFDSDAHSAVRSIADGVVIYTRQYDVWGNVVVIKYGRITARYAHLENVLVKEDQRVTQGQQIASVGNANGSQPYHLHFDICDSNALLCSGDDWPKLDKQRVLLNYANPLLFLQWGLRSVTTTDNLNVRSVPSTLGMVYKTLKKNTAVPVYVHDASWFKLADANGYISRQYTK